MHGGNKSKGRGGKTKHKTYQGENEESVSDRFGEAVTSAAGLAPRSPFPHEEMYSRVGGESNKEIQ